MKKESVTYCMATFYITGKNLKSLVLTDESAILVQLTPDKIEVVSKKYGIKKEVLESVTVSILDGRNSYLMINGQILDVSNTENGTSYTIKTPQKEIKTLANGMVLEFECKSVSKYLNIHKPKRKKCKSAE